MHAHLLLLAVVAACATPTAHTIYGVQAVGVRGLGGADEVWWVRAVVADVVVVGGLDEGDGVVTAVQVGDDTHTLVLAVGRRVYTYRRRAGWHIWGCTSWEGRTHMDWKWRRAGRVGPGPTTASGHSISSG